MYICDSVVCVCYVYVGLVCISVTRIVCMGYHHFPPHMTSSPSLPVIAGVRHLPGDNPG